MSSRCALHALVLLLSSLLAACNVALGPGYTVVKQEYAVQWTGTDQLLVKATYRVKNTGKVPLDYLDVTLPPEPRRSGLHVWFAETAVTPQAADEFVSAGTVRIPINPALPLKEKMVLAVEYSLAGRVGDPGASPSFYLEPQRGDSGWHPLLRERKGSFGAGGAPPEKWDLRITVPRGFLVHASGDPKGRKRRGEMVEYHFRQRLDSDSTPFVVAGRYHEWRSRAHGLDVYFWSPEAAQEADAERLGARLAATAAHYESTFGPRLPRSRDIWLVRIPVPTNPPDPRPKMGPAGKPPAFPDGIFVPYTGFEKLLGVPEECLADWYLAHVWLELVASPDRSAGDIFDALSSYMAESLPHGCGYAMAARALRTNPDRSALISTQLRAYLRGFPPGRSAKANLPEFVEMSLRTRLFMVALEDRLGRDRLNAALRRMLQSLRGETWSTNDLRVAIQLETGEDPAEFFRQWLNQPGIPEEFRKKYEQQASGSR